MKIITNGVFDILHPGHFNLLMYCRRLAGEGQVIVALDEDEKVMADKGLQRPIHNIHDRMKAICELQGLSGPLVDIVEPFSSNLSLYHLIRKHKPDIIVKGSDWEGKIVVGEASAKVMFFPRMDYSTTDIVRRVMEKNTILK
jgi:D-beta-D-heptose 7-phosphate kinase / D-beta-D-heptose 1-phosphate adenosyltransferase